MFLEDALGAFGNSLVKRTPRTILKVSYSRGEDLIWEKYFKYLEKWVPQALSRFSWCTGCYLQGGAFVVRVLRPTYFVSQTCEVRMRRRGRNLAQQEGDRVSAS